jgi:hypothetical protein
MEHFALRQRQCIDVEHALQDKVPTFTGDGKSRSQGRRWFLHRFSMKGEGGLDAMQHNVTGRMVCMCVAEQTVADSACRYLLTE